MGEGLSPLNDEELPIDADTVGEPTVPDRTVYEEFSISMPLAEGRPTYKGTTKPTLKGTNKNGIMDVDKDTETLNDTD